MRRVLIGIFLVSLVVWARPAAACGGLFCTNAPVDQAAEQIVFAVHEDTGTIDAYVRINYVGSSDAFSWVVPVPNNPQVDVGDERLFQVLSDNTRLRFNFPQPDCSTGKFREVDAALDGSSSNGRVIDGQFGGVVVMQHGSTGPYDFVVLGGESPTELVDWLRTNGYRVEDTQIPLMQPYIEAGMLFLAMKLSPDIGVQNIQPVKMTYKATQPMIPIQLTAVAATPDMGILVWIFADTPMVPANMADVAINPDDIALTDQFGTVNYNVVRGAALDAVGGHGFVVEYAQPSTTLASQLSKFYAVLPQLQTQHRYVTRLYGEMSPEEMTLDPVFRPEPELTPVSNVYDFTDRPSPYTCDGYGVSGVKSIATQQFEARAGLSPWPLLCWAVLALTLGGLAFGYYRTRRRQTARVAEAQNLDLLQNLLRPRQSQVSQSVSRPPSPPAERLDAHTSTRSLSRDDD